MAEQNLLTGNFMQVPQQQPSRIQRIGRGLMAFGAGAQGQGQQFLAGVQAQDQALSTERQRAMAQDAMQVYQMLGSGRYDDALDLMDQRVKLIGELGGDPSDTVELRQKVATGDLQGAMRDLQIFLGAAQQAGLIPQAETIKASDLIDGEIVRRDPLQGITRERITDPKTEETEGFRTLQARAREAGLQPGTLEYQEFMAQGGRSQADTNLQRVSAIVDGEERPTSLNYNPRTGAFTRQMPDGTEQTIPGSMVTQVSVQGAAGDVLPPVRMDTLQAERDWIGYQSSELGRMMQAIEADPSLAGAVGQVRRAGQQAIGAVSDLASIFGADGRQRASEFMVNAANIASQEVANGNMSESQFTKLFDDPNLSEIALFENTLAFTLARLRSPDGRLLSPIVNQSLQDAKITGFTSSQDVINKLGQIQRQLNARLEGLDRRMGRQQPAQQEELSIEQLLQRYAP
jgi:hypothetical protein